MWSYGMEEARWASNTRGKGTAGPGALAWRPPSNRAEAGLRELLFLQPQAGEGTGPIKVQNQLQG